ncbi:MAG: Fe-S cluster assembly ATPase SufC [bacterium]|nr:Fe-S cluster assembly ATPase SufC [bacterium]MDZ4285710.1 Fe-S cluster assembly ATPase SufC [Candidatus Sungbacteria bacterium]
MIESLLSVHNLHAEINGTPVLNGVDLSVGRGEIHVLMGPNGSGKSTLAHAVMGSPSVKIASGTVRLQNEDITHASPEDRARKGLYLAFQHPSEIAGVGMMPFMRSVLASKDMPTEKHDEFKKNLEFRVSRVGLMSDMLERNVNEGFSGGEKKRNELFQLSVLQPTVAIMDEVDSGLDVDGAQMAARELHDFADAGGSLLVITHTGVMARALNADRVYIMKGGRIITYGGKELMEFIEANGFESL